MGRQPNDRVGAGDRARLGHRGVVLADVDAVGAARLDQVGTVVQHEQGAVRCGRQPEWLGEGHQLLLAARGLLAELEDVCPTAKRRLEQQGRVPPVRQALADEVKARIPEPAKTLMA